MFNKNFSAIHGIKPVLILNRPIYVGFTDLEWSKWFMYDFHFNFIKKKIDAELLFTDTDSLTYEIKSENVYEEFFKWENLILYHRYYSSFQHLWNFHILQNLLSSILANVFMSFDLVWNCIEQYFVTLNDRQNNVIFCQNLPRF